MEGSLPDVRPIAVGETLRKLAGMCMCALVKDKLAESFQPLQLGVACHAWGGGAGSFQPLQLGVACHAGAEKVTQAMLSGDALRSTWMDEDLVVLKVDIRNAFKWSQTSSP